MQITGKAPNQIEVDGTEYKTVVDDSGMFKKMTKKKHGLVRRAGQFSIQEHTFVLGKQHGFEINI